MSRITSSIGLITGLPIEETVNQLISVSARPRQLIVNRNKALEQEQVAVTDLTARVLSLQFAVQGLKESSLFSEKKATSNNVGALSASVTGDPPLGQFQFTPVREVQTHELVSSGFAATDTAIGEGTLRFRFGGFIDRGESLDVLNGGKGVERGQIRITDRSGASDTVDLRFAQTIDDVLDAINAADGVDVRASADGDAIRLTDLTGQAAANLRVSEGGLGSVAADLGLDGINVAADTAQGEDVLRLFGGRSLSELNDGAGISFDRTLPDLDVTFRDGSSLLVDFLRVGEPESKSTAAIDSAGGESADLTFKATAVGADFDDYTITLVDDNTVTAGNEVVEYDSEAKTLTFRIDEGATTADDIIAALASDPAASLDFTAEKTGGKLFSSATTAGANGATAELTFTAVADGPEFDGYAISFVDDANVTAGSEVVEVDETAKTLTFRIDEGSTTADHVIAALAADETAGSLFTAEKTGGPLFSSATTSAAAGVDAQITLTAKTAGPELDGYTLSFVDDTGVAKGNEKVTFDAENKIIVVGIDAGASDAADVVAALEADADASDAFDFSLVGDGSGLVDVADTATTSGGISGLVAVGDGATTAGGISGFVSSTDSATTGGGAAIPTGDEQTLEDLLRTINEADPARLQAEISADGDGLRLIDLTTGNGEFKIESAFGGSVAEDLGLTGDADAGVITSARLQGGLKTSLLSSLGGGDGLGDLGQLAITDRSGAGATVDLSTAETLDDVVRLINDAGLGIAAGVNQARNGLRIEDTTGSSAANLTIASAADGLETAEKLKIAVDDAVDQVDSGTLDLQVISEDTKLKDLRGGRGVDRASFLVTDSNGNGRAFNLGQPGFETIGDLIHKINVEGFGVEARINDAGDGIVLIDVAGGSGTLKVAEVDGTAAANLGLLGDAKDVDIDGELRQTITGSTTSTIEISDTDTLSDVIDKINTLQAGVGASTFNVGSGSAPHRLRLLSQVAGKAGELLIDTSGVDFSFEQTSAAADAVLLVGGSSEGGGVLVSSSSGTFEDVLDGVRLTVNGPATSPVTVSVSRTESQLVSGIRTFVNQYNTLRKKLDEFTFFNEDQLSTGVLFGSNETLRIDTELSGLISSRHFGLGDIQSLAELGVDLKDDGTLSFNETEFAAKFAADPEAVESFFTTEAAGLAVKLDNLLETHVGRDNSLLVNRAETLQRRIDSNNERIEFMTERLSRERELLLNQFVQMEIAIGKMQNDLTAITSLQTLAPLSINSSNLGAIG